MLEPLREAYRDEGLEDIGEWTWQLQLLYEIYIRAAVQVNVVLKGVTTTFLQRNCLSSSAVRL